MYFDLGKYSLVAMERERFGVTQVFENPPDQELLLAYSRFEVASGITQQQAVEIVDYLYQHGPGMQPEEGIYFYTLPEWHNLFYVQYHQVQAIREIVPVPKLQKNHVEDQELVQLHSLWIKAPFNLTQVDHLIQRITEETRDLEREKGVSLAKGLEYLYQSIESLSHSETYYAYSTRSHHLIEVSHTLLELGRDPIRFGELVVQLNNVMQMPKEEIRQYLEGCHKIGILKTM
jgi:hypothetical protein